MDDLYLIVNIKTKEMYLKQVITTNEES